ncbi:MAG: hypothetical protein RLZZ148_666 [Cyanobacteriota bacterium]|jgi:hypothetical protein
MLKVRGDFNVEKKDFHELLKILKKLKTIPTRPDWEFKLNYIYL